MDGERVYRTPVIRLQQLSALTDQHFALRLAVRDLEFTWGRPARVKSLVSLIGVSEETIRRHLQELAEVGYVEWLQAEDAACFVRGMPLLGEVG